MQGHTTGGRGGHTLKRGDATKSVHSGMPAQLRVKERTVKNNPTRRKFGRGGACTQVGGREGVVDHQTKRDNGKSHQKPSLIRRRGPQNVKKKHASGGGKPSINEKTRERILDSAEHGEG